MAAFIRAFFETLTVMIVIFISSSSSSDRWNSYIHHFIGKLNTQSFCLTYFVCNFPQSTRSDTTFLHWRGHSCNDPKNHFWECKSSVSLHSLKEDHTIRRDIFCVRQYSYSCNDQDYHCVTYNKCDTLAPDNQDHSIAWPLRSCTIVYHIASLFAGWQIEDQDPLIEVGLVLGCTCLPNRGENLQSDRCHHPRLQLRLCSPEINMKIAWENTQHSATPPPISPQNDVWETTAEIPPDDASIPRSG